MRSGIVASMRRSLGVFVTQEFARHRLRRLPLVGGGVAAAVFVGCAACVGWVAGCVGMVCYMVEGRCLGMRAPLRLRTSLPSRPPRRGWA